LLQICLSLSVPFKPFPVDAADPINPLNPSILWVKRSVRNRKKKREHHQEIVIAARFSRSLTTFSILDTTSIATHQLNLNK
jgi:hypothetical protein